MLPHSPATDLPGFLLRRLHEVREALGLSPLPDDPELTFAEALDSMAFVEFLAAVAADCGVGVEALEAAAGPRYTTVSALAEALLKHGLGPHKHAALPSVQITSPVEAHPPLLWLASASAVLPRRVQHADEL